MTGQRPDPLARLPAVPAVLLAIVVLAIAAAGAALVDAVSDVRGQVALEAGELEQRERFLVRIDDLHESSMTEWRLTEVGAWVPGQVEVGDTPGQSRLPGDGAVTGLYYDDELVALDTAEGRVTSVLFGLRGAVSGGLLAVGLLLVAGYTVRVLSRRPRARGWWAPDPDPWWPAAPTSRAVGIVLGATALAWLCVVSALPVLASVLLVEATGVALAVRTATVSREAPARS